MKCAVAIIGLVLLLAVAHAAIATEVAEESRDLTFEEYSKYVGM